MFGAIGGATPIGWKSALGANVLDVDGNRYVDLTGGFGAALVGHRNPRVVRAIAHANRRLIHALADAAPHPDRAELAHELVARGPIPAGRVVFAGSGAEAIDIALKTAHLVTGKIGVVAFERGYHGTGLGALRATGRDAFRQPFDEALAPATLRVPFGDIDGALESVDAWSDDATKPPLGAWIVEPVLGREGVFVPPRGYLRRLGEVAHGRDLLVIADEILTGGGRTGQWWASGPLQPDLVVVGKGITGGQPLAAVLGGARLMRAWEGEGEARHAATFMANPVAVAATRAALVEIERRDLSERARVIGRRLRRGLALAASTSDAVAEVRGVGGMWGVAFQDDKGPSAARAGLVSRALEKRGFLALPGGRDGDVLVLTPPLTITDRQLDAFLDAFSEALTDIA